MPGKKIIVACDGTWVDSDNGFERDSWLPWKNSGHLAIPSNVTRFTRALLPEHASGTAQIVYYQAGLGSADNAYSFFVGGYLGAGISENIREAYAFLCNNYTAGDEIYLVGFSRGAFTARSVLGLIAAVGLLTKAGLVDFYTVFRDWQNQNDPGYYRPSAASWIPAASVPEPRPDFRTDPKAYVAQLDALGLTRPDVCVEAVAVWDTVGSLGIPRLAPWPLAALTARERDAYSFVDTEIPPNLKKAYQALALDERRTPFSPSVWEMPAPGGPAVLDELRQCWFPGAHSGVGGGYADSGTADVALAWLVARLEPHLSFDGGYVKEQRALNGKYLAAADPGHKRPWGCGKVYGSAGGLVGWLTGTATRTPGTYTRTDPMTGKSTGELLRETHEFVHPCVRVRRVLGGLGTNDGPVYNDSWPLKGWTLVEPRGKFKADQRKKGFSKDDLWGKEWDAEWKWVLQDPATGKVTWIAEEEMDGAEWDLVAPGSEAAKAIAAV